MDPSVDQSMYYYAPDVRRHAERVKENTISGAIVCGILVIILAFVLWATGPDVFALWCIIVFSVTCAACSIAALGAWIVTMRKTK